jgi:hypothetical protein
MPISKRSVSSLSDFIKQILSIRDSWQKEDDEDPEDAKEKADGSSGPIQIWFRGEANAR